MCNCDVCHAMLSMCSTNKKKVIKAGFQKILKNQKCVVPKKKLQNRKLRKKVCNCDVCNVLLSLYSINKKSIKSKHVLKKKI